MGSNRRLVFRGPERIVDVKNRRCRDVAGLTRLCVKLLNSQVALGVTHGNESRRSNVVQSNFHTSGARRADARIRAFGVGGGLA